MTMHDILKGTPAEETVREATKLLRLFQNRMAASRDACGTIEDEQLWDRINQSCANLGHLDSEWLDQRDKAIADRKAAKRAERDSLR